MKKQNFLKNGQKHLSLNFRIIGIFGLIVFALLTQNVVSAQTTSGESWSTTPTPSSSQQSSTLILKTQEDVQAFMTQERVKPLPGDYEIPAYISSGKKVGDVFNELKNRYPEFYGISKSQLLDAVKSNPTGYTKMLDENKAIRRYFDPNSKY